jgi:hypothetical protein
MRIGGKLALAVVIMLSLVGPVLAEPIFDYDVTWTINSRFTTTDRSGSVSLEGRGPGQLFFLPGTLTPSNIGFSDGTTGAAAVLAGPIVPGGTTTTQDIIFSSGLPSGIEVTTPGFGRQRAAISFSDADFSTFTLDGFRSFDCNRLAGCGGASVLNWSSEVHAVGTRTLAAGEPEVMTLFAAVGIVAAIVIRRRRADLAV